MNKLALGFLILVAAVNSFAGGSTQSAPLPDGIVSCSGTNGEILFNVFKNEYKGELLSLNNTSTAIIKITDEQIILQAKKAGLLNVMQWDQTAFLRSIGVDPATVRDNLTLFVNTAQKNQSTMTVTNLQGGTLKVSYSSKHLVIPSDVAPYKQVAPKLEYFLRASVQQISQRLYQVNLKKIQSGQKICVREQEMPNPYFVPGSGSPKTFIGCVEFKDISEQQTVASFSTYLQVENCRLK